MIAFGVLLLVAATWAAQPETPTTLTLYGSQHVGLVPRKPITLLDVHVRPVIVLAEVSDHGVAQLPRGVIKREITQAPISLFGKAFNAYYLQYGLRTVKDYKNFESLYQYFVHSDALSGVVFFPDQQQDIFNPFFLKNFLNNVVLPDNLSILEYFKSLAYPVPVLVVTPTREFSSFDFRGFSDIGTFVFGEEEEVVPQVGGQPSQISFFNPYVYPTLFVPTRPGDVVVPGSDKDDKDKPPSEIPDKVVPTVL